jgi:hypothetical protein
MLTSSGEMSKTHGKIAVQIYIYIYGNAKGHCAAYRPKEAGGNKEVQARKHQDKRQKCLLRRNILKNECLSRLEVYPKRGVGY